MVRRQRPAPDPIPSGTTGSQGGRVRVGHHQQYPLSVEQFDAGAGAVHSGEPAVPFGGWSMRMLGTQLGARLVLIPIFRPRACSSNWIDFEQSLRHMYRDDLRRGDRTPKASQRFVRHHDEYKSPSPEALPCGGSRLRLSLRRLRPGPVLGRCSRTTTRPTTPRTRADDEQLPLPHTESASSTPVTTTVPIGEPGGLRRAGTGRARLLRHAENGRTLHDDSWLRTVI